MKPDGRIEHHAADGARTGQLSNRPLLRISGDTRPFGAQMRYAVHASDGTPLAMLGFSNARPARDFIGSTREKNLPLDTRV